MSTAGTVRVINIIYCLEMSSNILMHSQIELLYAEYCDFTQ